MRILIVEDHAETRRLLEHTLRDAGFVPEGVASAAAAQAALTSQSFALAVVDWMLPDGSGVDMIRALRADQNTLPVLLLTARDAVEDRVVGLDAGADDYLRKPFAVAEFLARVRALLRRGPRLESRVVQMGPIEVHLDERTVLRDGAEVPVTKREFEILEVLLRSRGRTVSRTEMLQSVWGSDTEGNEASLEVLIGRLRRKLGHDAGEEWIRTHRGYGYSLRVHA